MTRAFHYAGARSALASLWSVADETTAVLIERFYGYLKVGKSKDGTPRSQLDLTRRSTLTLDRTKRNTKPDGSHPYYWEAFLLNGE